jgi:prevent-host-death family protein
MRIVNIHEAKTHLSRFVAEVADRRETIIIAKAGKPMARLVPYTPERPQRIFGLLEGKIRMAEDFDAPLPAELLKDFEGEV